MLARSVPILAGAVDTRVAPIFSRGTGIQRRSELDEIGRLPTVDDIICHERGANLGRALEMVGVRGPRMTRAAREGSSRQKKQQRTCVRCCVSALYPPPGTSPNLL